MRKNKWKLKLYVRITAAVILLSFLGFPVSAEPLTGPPPNLNGSGTGLYSDLEVDALIEEISQAAHEAIGQAAGEAAKAAALAAVEREAAIARDMQRWRLEAEIRQQKITETKKAGVKNAVITGLLCLASGFIVGMVINR